MGTLAEDHAATLAYVETLWQVVLHARARLAEIDDEESSATDVVAVGDVLARAGERRACIAALDRAEARIAIVRAATPLRELAIQLARRNKAILATPSTTEPAR